MGDSRRPWVRWELAAVFGRSLSLAFGLTVAEGSLASVLAHARLISAPPALNLLGMEHPSDHSIGSVILVYLAPIASRSDIGNGDRDAVRWVTDGLSAAFSSRDTSSSTSEKVARLFAIDLLSFNPSYLHDVGPQRTMGWRRAIDNLFDRDEVASDLQAIRDAYGTSQWELETARFDTSRWGGFDDVGLDRLRDRWSAQLPEYLGMQLRWMKQVENRLAAARKRPPPIEWVLSEIERYRDGWRLLLDSIARAPTASDREEGAADSLALKKHNVFIESYWLHQWCELYCGRSYAWNPDRADA